MGIKMDKTAIIVCSVVGSLGLLSAIFGFSAEGTKLTPYTILVYGDDCIYPPNPALGLGICAAIFLLVAQVIITAVGGCCGCCKSRAIPSETKRIVGIVCAVFSWIAAVIAWALLIEGAAWSTNVVREDAPYCPYLKDGIFAGGGVLCLAASALGIASFIMLRSPPVAATATAAVGSTPNATSGMSSPAVGVPLLPLGGKPQIPPSPTVPQSQPQQVYTQQNLAVAEFTPAQTNGSHHAPNNQQQLPPQVPPAAAAAPVVACAALAPGELSPPPLGIPTGLAQPQVALPQVQTPSIPVPVPLGGGMPPVTLPTAVPQPGSEPSALSTVIRNEVARQGVKFAAHVVSQTLLSDNSAGDGVLSMTTTDSAGGDTQVTN